MTGENGMVPGRSQVKRHISAELVQMYSSIITCCEKQKHKSSLNILDYLDIIPVLSTGPT